MAKVIPILLLSLLFLGCVPNQELNPNTAILFTSRLCGPCHAAKAIISKLDVDVIISEDDELLTRKYNIIKVPTLIIRKNSKEVKRAIGLKSEKTYRKLLCTN